MKQSLKQMMKSLLAGQAEIKAREESRQESMLAILRGLRTNGKRDYSLPNSVRDLSRRIRPAQKERRRPRWIIRREFGQNRGSRLGTYPGGKRGAVELREISHDNVESLEDRYGD
jgi:hypothetical protein